MNNHALIKAVEKHDIELVKCLCEVCHTDVNFMTESIYAEGTPLFHAVYHNDFELAKYLCEECHANTEIKGKCSGKFWEKGNEKRYNAIFLLVERCKYRDKSNTIIYFHIKRELRYCKISYFELSRKC